MISRWDFLLGAVFWVISLNVYGEKLSDAIPTVEHGAKVYVQRCTLCHGSQGMGEGNLPLKIKDYPSTNLLENKKTQNFRQVYDAVSLGGVAEGSKLSRFMPPMGAELTWTELESVVLFVMQLRENYEDALVLLKKESNKEKPSLKLGQQTYANRCVLCHGKYGEGDGRMKKIIKSPPPFNLTLSRMSDTYLKKIISGGGESVNRSPQMPPWKDQLNDVEIDSVVLYLKSLRSSP